MLKLNLDYSNNTFDYRRMEFIKGKVQTLNYQVLYCDKVYLLDQVEKLTRKLDTSSILGFDTETALTNFNIDHNNERPTIIQYGNTELVIVINVSAILRNINEEEFLSKIPSMKKILTSRDNIKVGVDLIHDVSKLKAMGINVEMYLDLQWMALCLGYTEKGLNSLASRVIGSEKITNNFQHNWYNVNNDMVEYAARDVILPELIFNNLFNVLYEFMISQVIPNMEPNKYYDLFDLSCIMVNHSKHNMNSNINIRNFIIRSMNMYGIICNTMVSDGYLGLVDGKYVKISDIVSDIPQYNNPVQFVPLTKESYKSITDPEVVKKLDYYEQEQRVRLLTSEENIIINDHMLQKNRKYDQIEEVQVNTDDPEVLNIMRKLPQMTIFDASTLVNILRNYKINRSLYDNLPCKPIGDDKNKKAMYEAKVKNNYNKIIAITSKYHTTPRELGYSVKNIELKTYKCIQPKSYAEQVSLDDIIGMIPKSVVSSDVDSFIQNVVNVQDSIKYLTSVSSNPTKSENTLINENRHKYESNMSKLKNRVKRFGLNPDIFTFLPEPFMLD